MTEANFDSEDLELLKGSSLPNQILYDLTSIKFQYMKICQHNPNFHNQFSFDDYLYIVSIYYSRSFAIKHGNNPANPENTIIPFIDLFNHRNLWTDQANT